MIEQPSDFIILVAGGRNYFNMSAIAEALDRLHAERPVTLVVHGAASGSDALSGRWAKERGIPCIPYPSSRKLDGPGSDWKYRRNARMLHSAKPHLVVAFPGGPGTRHMAETAKSAGYQVWNLRPGPANQPLPRLPQQTAA